MLDKVHYDILSSILSLLGMKSYIAVILVCKNCYNNLYPSLREKFPIFVEWKKDRKMKRERDIRIRTNQKKNIKNRKKVFLCMNYVVQYLFGKCKLNVLNSLVLPERIMCGSSGDMLKSSILYSVYVDLKKQRDRSLIDIIHSRFKENMVKCNMFCMTRIGGTTKIKIVLKPIIAGL